MATRVVLPAASNTSRTPRENQSARPANIQAAVAITEANVTTNSPGGSDSSPARPPCRDAHVGRGCEPLAPALLEPDRRDVIQRNFVQDATPAPDDKFEIGERVVGPRMEKG